MSLFEQPPNIASVTVRGKQVTQYFDLDDEPTFNVETDAGNRYLVEASSREGKKHRAWKVSQLEDDDRLVEIGRVYRAPLSYEHQYTPANSYIPEGSQGDLWNAVQSLLA